MKWYAISGSWKISNLEVKKDLPEEIRKKIEELKQDVTKDVKQIARANNGIITGGALGVDSYATETVLKYGNPSKQLKIYLPINIEDFCNHYSKRAGEGVITSEQAQGIISLLKECKKISEECIFDDWGWKEANIESYYGRNTFIIRDADELYAYHVNDTKGTKDIIDKAIEMGKPTHVKKYYI